VAAMCRRRHCSRAESTRATLLLDIEKTQADYEAARPHRARSAIRSTWTTSRDALDNYERLAKTGQYPLADLEKQRRLYKQIEQKLALEKVNQQGACSTVYENTPQGPAPPARQDDHTRAVSTGIVSASLALPGDLISSNFSIATLIATSRTATRPRSARRTSPTFKLGQKATVALPRA